MTFRQGEMTGEGRDKVAKFLVRGRYDVADGKCHWHNRYVGGHDVFYQGYAENKGIWGTWELHPREIYGLVKGGFHIWPKGLADPTQSSLSEEAEVPMPAKRISGSAVKRGRGKAVRRWQDPASAGLAPAVRRLAS